MHGTIACQQFMEECVTEIGSANCHRQLFKYIIICRQGVITADTFQHSLRVSCS